MILSVTGELLSGLCRSWEAVLASSRIIDVNGTRSIVTSFGSACSGDRALMIASVCRCGILMGVLCSDDGVRSVCTVDSAAIMGMFAVCIVKCVDVDWLHGICVLGRYNPPNCRWHKHGTPTTEYAMAFLVVGVLCWQMMW